MIYVITSYSIHYTKLYDGRLHAVLIFVQKGVVRLVFVAVQLRFLTAKTNHLLQPGTEERDRITSYNVCYTKLLRMWT